MDPIFVTKADVVKLVGLSKRTVDRLEAEGKFPKRIRISHQKVLWRYTDIISWAERLTDDTTETIDIAA